MIINAQNLKEKDVQGLLGSPVYRHGITRDTISGMCVDRTGALCVVANWVGNKHRNCYYRECAECLEDSDCRYDEHCNTSYYCNENDRDRGLLHSDEVLALK